jgi:cytochrome c553
MKNWIISCVVAIMLPLDVSAETAPAAGQVCVTCHGPAGVSVNPEWPNLAGQHAGYLANQLIAFRDGVRKNPVMTPFVMNLNDAAIAELAAFYAARPLAIAANGDSALVARGESLSAYCKACHGMQGIPATSEWPILAGQHATYLQKQMAMFKSGERANALMSAALSGLGDPEFAALAAYYSQLKP